MTSVDCVEDMSTSNQTNATSIEKSMETVEDRQIIHKIDRLSLLPNELLDHIFDLAYSIDTPSTGALSKHLLPFHITGIYRRISFTKPDKLASLVDKVITSSANLGERIRSLRLSDMPSTTENIFEDVDFERFFRQLTRLDSLDLGSDDYELLDRIISYHANPFLPVLRHLSSNITGSDSYPLLEFTVFPTLQSLVVSGYHDPYGAHDITNKSLLPILRRLEISGVYADDLSIASFCALCPNLTELTLKSDSPGYSDLLKSLPSNLLGLGLWCLGDQPDDVCERHLFRFANLRHLVLGNGMFTSVLPAYLIGLRALEILELGRGRISTNGMHKLFNKVPINRLKLDLTRGEIGYRLEVDENGSAGGRWVPGEGRLAAGDWVIPNFDLQGEGGFTLDGAREMLREAEEMGIEVEGSILRAIEVMDAYHLEIANLAIYRCSRDKTFNHYSNVKEQNLHARLPLLDLNSLDSSRFKIRKMQLEKEGWFALTWEN